MSWREILKNDNYEIAHAALVDKLEKLVNKIWENVKFFEPEIPISAIFQGIAPYMSEPEEVLREEYNIRDIEQEIRKLSPIERSLEFMRPVKGDIEFISHMMMRKTLIVYKHSLNEVPISLTYQLRDIGDVSKDNFIRIGGDEKHNLVCLKQGAGGSMTNGDFLTTLVYAEKNNAIPDIIKLIAYVHSRDLFIRQSTIYNTDEEEYKKSLLVKIADGKYNLFDAESELNYDTIIGFNLNDVNFWLGQLGVPEDILGRW